MHYRQELLQIVDFSILNDKEESFSTLSGWASIINDSKPTTLSTHKPFPLKIHGGITVY